jgi:glycosyltransferase involved in cell wall biosynthesis
VIESNRKILFVIGHSGIGGTELQILKTTNLINARGYESEIWIIGKSGPLNELAESIKVPVKNFNVDLKKNKFSGLIQLVKLGVRLRKNKFDVVHAFLPQAIILFLPLALLFTPSTKRIAGIRGSKQKSNFFIDSLFGIILKSSWRIICNADYLSKNIEDKFHIDPKKILVIHNGVSKFDFAAAIKSEIPTGLVIANFHSYKGHLMLLEALSNIKDEYRVVLCGSGVLQDEVSNNISRLNLGGKVVIDDSAFNVKESLRISDFAIHPSETEGLSNAILEELSAGLPVIAFNVGGNRELITSDVNGFLIEPFNLLQLQNKIENLIQNHNLRNKMSLAAVKSAENFSWEIHIDRLLLAYELGQK